MQSLTVYGRMVVRALLTEMGGGAAGEPAALALLRHGGSQASSSLRRPVHLVAASAGISKTHSITTQPSVVARAMGAAAAAAGGPGGVRGTATGTMGPPEGLGENRTFGDDAFFFAKHRLGDVLGEFHF